MDPLVLQYCTLKENCRRRFMLQALGSAEVVSTSGPCCDVCAPDHNIPCVLHPVDIPVSQKRTTRRVALRIVSDDLMKILKANLEAERESYLSEHPSLRMLGLSFVCADCIIEKICADSKFISSIEDLGTISIGPDIKFRFLEVILNTLSLAPTPRRHNVHHQY